MTPKPLIYIYTYGDCTELFLYIKKNAHFYKDCRGFWTKKKRTFGGKNQLFDNFFDGFDLKTAVVSDLDPQNHVLS